MSISEFFFMGGYGFYVWASFGMTALLIISEVMYIKSQRRATLKRLRRLTRINDGIKNET